MGASVLPATIFKNKVYLLFGKERDTDETPGWSDFGGGTDKGETFLDTAEREGGEELTGFLGDKKDIKQLLKKHGTFNVDFKSDGHSTYRAHIFPMEYDDKLPYYYNNNQRFLQKHLDPSIIHDTKIFEKTQIKWFCIDELKKHKKQFRNFYQNIIDLIVKDKDSIDSFIRRSLKIRKNKTRKIK
jgi:8-oxo-dGTP pyrophosphatase MutT (NUDIX family)